MLPRSRRVGRPQPFSQVRVAGGEMRRAGVCGALLPNRRRGTCLRCSEGSLSYIGPMQHTHGGVTHFRGVTVPHSVTRTDVPRGAGGGEWVASLGVNLTWVSSSRGPGSLVTVTHAFHVALPLLVQDCKIQEGCGTKHFTSERWKAFQTGNGLNRFLVLLEPCGAETRCAGSIQGRRCNDISGEIESRTVKRRAG